MIVKRGTVVFTVLVLLLVGIQGFAAGGSPTGTAEAEVMSIVLVDQGYVAWEKGMELWTLQEMGKAAGLQFQVTPYTGDIYTTKITTMLASGDIPDVFMFPGDEQMIYDYGDQGAFLSVKDHFSKLPNMVKLMDLYKSQLPIICSPTTGNLYTLPRVNLEAEQISKGLIGRVDILENAGIDWRNLKSVEDLKSVFRALKKGNNDKAIMGSRSGFTQLFPLANVFGMQWVPRGGTEAYWSPDENSYTHATLHPDRTKDFLRLVDFMQKEGMLDPEFLTMQDEVWDPSFHEGRWVFDCQGEGWLRRANTSNPGNLGYPVKWEFIMPPPYQGKIWPWDVEANLRLEFHYIVNAKPKVALDKLLKTMDWTFGNEGITAWMMGREGVTYDKVQDPRNHGIKLRGYPFDPGDFNENFFKVVGAYWKFSPTAGYYGFAAAMMPESDPTIHVTSDQNRLFIDYVKAYTRPLMMLTADEQMEADRISSAVRTAMDEFGAKVILGEKTPDDFDEVVAFAKKQGVEQLVQIYNTAHKRFYGN